MKKRFLCVLAAAAVLLSVLAGCGGGPSGGSDPGKPGAESTQPDKPGKPDKGGQTDDGQGKQTDGDPAAVMEARVKAVNDAINYTCVGLEEMVETGLLFYGLTYGRSGDEPHDYKPDKPLDYYAWYEMYIGHTEGIVSKDTYIPLLKNERYTGEVVASDVIETDDLYVYYSPNDRSGSAKYRPWCYLLVKGTDIVYLFTVGEQWFIADYYENGYYHIENSNSASALPQDAMDLSYTGDDAEYLFTEEFWKAFARTAKFVGNPDDDFKKGECINTTVSSIGRINGYDENKNEIRVKVPYIEEWYAGGHYGRDAIRRGFEAFLKNRDEEVSFYLSDGTTKTYPATRDGDMVTVDFGDGQTWIYEDDGHGALRFSWDIIKENPEYGALEELPPETGYSNFHDGILVIDDFGQGEPTMFFNNGLYKYAGNDEATLIHDFSGIEESWYWTSIYTDANRTHLMFSGGPWRNEELKIVDLKTFEVTDEVYVIYDADDDGIWEFSYAEVNGVTVDESAGWAAADQWHSNCNITLCDMDINYEIDLNAAWKEYESRS